MTTPLDCPVLVDDLHLRFGRSRVLEGASLQLAPGQTTVLLGANGSGKSSLFRVLLGVLKPQRGTVEVCGHNPLRHHRRALQSVGYVPDTPDVPARTTPNELFALCATLYPKWNPDLCRDLSHRFEVPVTTAIGRMSRGQGMKAMLVAALAHEPTLLLLDEPFAGLDPMVREDVLALVIDALNDPASSTRRTVLCATHELDVAARIADRVAVLHEGRITRHGNLDEVLPGEQPQSTPRALHELLVETCSPSDAADQKELVS